MSGLRLSQRRVVLAVLVLGACAGAIGACADDAPGTVGPAEDGGADAARDGSSRKDGGGSDDAGPKTTCSITRAYFAGCGNEGDLNCGPDEFDAWCAENDQKINSEAYRRAEALCLTDANCDGAKRRDCEYEHYNGETPTASQKALVTAYCETCEPSDVSGCTARSTTYEPAKGIGSVPDIFIAAWELADPIVDEIKTKCTGGSEPDAGACAKAFAGCAGDIYIGRLPDCPSR